MGNESVIGNSSTIKIWSNILEREINRPSLWGRLGFKDLDESQPSEDDLYFLFGPAPYSPEYWDIDFLSEDAVLIEDNIGSRYYSPYIPRYSYQYSLEIAGLNKILINASIYFSKLHFEEK